jgi:hypothetical protein
MAEFFEVPIRREDGSEALHYVNVEAVAYAERADAEGGGGTSPGPLKVYLNNGYWFTVSGPKADEVLRLIQNRLCIQFRRDAGKG